MASRLDTYRAKRDFAKTTEPAPRKRPRRVSGDPIYMVHKHDATRLHYDLRLELNGALASWAIPRGPSYDPSEKRLAVQTEDHPFEYKDFEGRIPDEEYGGGDSLIWDKGTYRTEPPGRAEAMREKGHLVLRFDGEKLKGLWHLVRTRPVAGKSQWIFFKAKDELVQGDYDVVAMRPESVVSGRRLTRGPVSERTLRAPHPTPIDLLLRVWPPAATVVATDSAKLPRDGFRCEVKYDGYRALASVSGRRVALQSRNGLDLARRFPRLATDLSRLRVGEAVLDGEIVALDSHGVSRFELVPEGEGLQFIAFDLLWLDGEDLRARPLEDRRELLESLLSNAPESIAIAERLADEPDEALAIARRRGLEGIVAKRRASTYRGGATGDWRKLKITNSQEAAIVGFLPLKGTSRQVGSLLLAVQEDGRLRFAGRVGTGFTSKQRRELFEQLDPGRRESAPCAGAPRLREARWIEPGPVAQVRFAEWTPDRVLRHPCFQGLRVDRRPEDCRVEPARRAPVPRCRR